MHAILRDHPKRQRGACLATRSVERCILDGSGVDLIRFERPVWDTFALLKALKKIVKNNQEPARVQSKMVEAGYI
ncbi:hypothetical protein ACS3SW_07050 [Roseobacteraceae bacterium S113]